ncbi:Alpha/Beta hydrolase protein [Cyathus striatus]|nr:Alpha/Beta hydrolase protein [Cyathus striatus]
MPLEALTAHFPTGLGLAKSLALATAFTPLLLTLFPPTRPKPHLPPLPAGIERIFIPISSGQLEVLVSHPPSGVDKAKAPILFVHGGYGSAWCWTHWVSYFSGREGRVVYAVSLSGHGDSTRPPYFHLLPKSYFAKDVLAVLSYISEQAHPLPPVLVGHSAGGGLAQYVLDCYGHQLREENKISGMICVSPFPPSGGLPVYTNWLRIDPTVLLRMTLSGNAYTALNTPRRVSRAFFGVSHARSLYANDSGEDTVPEGFMRQMNKEESIIWPSTMMLPFVDTQRVIQHLTFSRGGEKDETCVRIALVAGSCDALMSPSVMRLMQRTYGDGCVLQFVDGAGHHLMHDMQWEVGAGAVERIVGGWGI